MRFDYIFIAFGIFAGAGIVLFGTYLPVMKAIPPMMWLLAFILVFDIVTAYIRGVPVMNSVSIVTRVLSFVSGSLVLILLGGIGV